MWVRVWLCANETRTVGRPGSWAPDNPITFLLPCTGAEVIVPEITKSVWKKREKRKTSQKKKVGKFDETRSKKV